MTESSYFGFRQVPEDQKQGMVNQVFSSVAGRYDLMNDLMSMGIHRIWKKFAIEQAYLKPKDRILDLAGGTGDLTQLIHHKLAGNGQLTLADINFEMISTGRERLVNHNIVQNLSYVQANAEALPFQENSFDCIFMSFGLRNVTHIDRALESMYQSLAPGGRVIVLEFSKPHAGWFEKLYDAYSFHVLPKMGQWVVGDADSYQYLAESIRKHPDQETLKNKMLNAGFEKVQYFNLSGGIVALHRGYKF
jgi:demethylmenaquinone methyltransferase / 2-methoxy-6-polyprenyl-1,4-benzoquinol methylase